MKIELPGPLASRVIQGRTRVAKPKIPYWGILYHSAILMSIVQLGNFKMVR